MLHTLVAALLLAWMLGMIAPFASGVFIHILLVVAVVMVLLKSFSRRRLL